MATRQSVDEHLQHCEDAITNAEEEYNKARRQEYWDDEMFTSSLLRLEDAYNDLEKLAHSCNDQQREQLHRMRLQLQQWQNKMMLMHRWS